MHGKTIANLKRWIGKLSVWRFDSYPLASSLTICDSLAVHLKRPIVLSDIDIDIDLSVKSIWEVDSIFSWRNRAHRPNQYYRKSSRPNRFISSRHRFERWPQNPFALTKIDLRSWVDFVPEKFVLQPTLQIRTTPSWDAQHTTHQMMAVYEHLS